MANVLRAGAKVVTSWRWADLGPGRPRAVSLWGWAAIVCGLAQWGRRGPGMGADPSGYLGDNNANGADDTSGCK